MTNTASFERINYLTRPNKSIERKIIFESLVKLHPLISFAAYRYMGFGSMWFGDFLFAHRLLGIEKMWSIEFAENSDRAEFNRPYRSIEIKSGKSGAVLDGMTEEQWNVPCIVWLDYTCALNADVVSDMRKLCVRLKAGSFLIVSVNAVRASYRVNDVTSLDKPKKIPAFRTVESLLGSACVANSFRTIPGASGEPDEVADQDFHLFLSDALLSFVAHSMVAAGRTDGATAARFVPMFNFSHRDGADMVTVGGVLSAPQAAGSLEAVIKGLCAWDEGVARPKHTRLDLVELTLKEKTTLDRLLPTTNDAEFVGVSKTAGILLADDQIAKYRECYRHFPVFIESLI
jgi:hypothetical protein